MNHIAHLMPEPDLVEFTQREKFIVSYFRSELPDSRRPLFWDIAIVLASLVCVMMFVTKEEMAYGFVAYALIIGRLGHIVVEGGRWTRDMRSIFAKYDAKIRELTEAQKEKGSGHNSGA